MPETGMVWNLILSVAAGVIVWWIRGINLKIDELYGLINKTRENIAREYALKIEVEKDIQKILDRFDRLENKLDKIIDKMVH